MVSRHALPARFRDVWSGFESECEYTQAFGDSRRSGLRTQTQTQTTARLSARLGENSER